MSEEAQEMQTDVHAATATVNGVQIHYERCGEGDVPLVLVHGSWASHHDWDDVVPGLAESFQVVTYDRRGHSLSERPPGQGSIHEDVADLAALIERLGLAPAWVVGQSFGASIVLRLAATRAELLRGVIAHEPPLFGLISDDPDLVPLLQEFGGVTATVTDRIASGDHEGGAQQFMKDVLGVEKWSEVDPDLRATMIENAPTFVDEARDPDQLAFDLSWLAAFDRPVMLTKGSESLPTFHGVVSRLADALPAAEVVRFEGAAHRPHETRPDEFIEATRDFIRRNGR